MSQVNKMNKFQAISLYSFQIEVKLVSNEIVKNIKILKIVEIVKVVKIV